MARPRVVDDRALLDAAMFAFWAQGYDGVSTRALEEATGLPASSLYHRHGSKEGLYAAALAHYIERVIERRIARFLADADAPRGLRAFFTSVYRTGGHPYHACLLANTAGEACAGLPAVRPVLARGLARLHDAFRDAVARGQAAGTLRAGIDPRAAADFLLLGLTGLLTTARQLRDHDRLDAVVDLMLGALA